MSNKLFLRPDLALKQTDMVFEWALYDVSGQQIKYGAADSLESIDQILMQNAITHTETTVFWPANAANYSVISLPGNQSRYIQQVLPFTVEEHIGQDLEQVHLAYRTKGKSDKIPVVTVDRALFARCYELLSSDDFDHSLNAIYLDAQMLPASEQDMHICMAGKNTLLRQKNETAVSIRADNLFPYLDTVFHAQTLQAEQGDEQDTLNIDFNIKIYTNDSDQEQSQLQIAQIAQYPNVQVDAETISISDFDLLCQNFFSQTLHREELPINLCQGAFRKLSESGEWWKRWRAVAVIAGLGFLLQLGVFIGKGIWYEKQAAVISQSALAEYKKIAPGNKNVSLAKLPRIIKGKLNQKNKGKNGDVGFLELLGEAGYQFRYAEDKTKLEFKSINYNKQRGALIIEMLANSFDQLDKFKQAIVAAGLSAEISSAVQEDKFMRGRISVSGS